MTSDQMGLILTRLVAAYPHTRATEETVRFYRRALGDLDFEPAERAIDLWTRSERMFPSISEFMEAYRRAKHDHDRPPEPKPTKPEPPPVWVKVWDWATHTGKVKPDSHWPQFVGPQYKPDVQIISQADYDRLHSEWEAAGSPISDLLGRFRKAGAHDVPDS